VNSYRPGPVNLQAFPGVEEDCVTRLTAAAIKNSRHLFNQTRAAGRQADLSQQTGIALQALNELIALSDLVRISGVGPVFARMLYDADVNSTTALAQAQAAPLYSQLYDLNKARTYTKAAFTEKDVAYCIELAQKLP
jgi:predicted flap endonuclease-1-like 5' DNA nuclease